MYHLLKEGCGSESNSMVGIPATIGVTWYSLLKIWLVSGSNWRWKVHIPVDYVDLGTGLPARSTSLGW